MSKSVLVANVLPAEALALIPKEISVDYHDSLDALPRSELMARIRGKDGLICHILSTIDDELLAAAPTVKVVANVGVGVPPEADADSAVDEQVPPDRVAPPVVDLPWLAAYDPGEVRELNKRFAPRVAALWTMAQEGKIKPVAEPRPQDRRQRALPRRAEIDLPVVADVRALPRRAGRAPEPVRLNAS